MKKFLLVSFFYSLVSILSAQENIYTTQVFADTSSFPFTSEWQYLSTDIYLFNGTAFNTIINEISTKGKKRKGPGLFRKFNEEQLEYLFITAKLKNVRFFGDKDITYPLYNFQINKDSENKYKTYVSDNIEFVRILDNLPLYNSRSFIDAELNVKAISYNHRDQLFSLVATQLQALAQIETFSNAVLSLIGEFGHFMESSSRKKEYRFSSTIRLYEQKNFNTRLHSVKIYAIHSNYSKDISLDTEDFKQYLSENDSPEINRKNLNSLIGSGAYPYIVVANYKSVYKMETITGDEISFANIDKRKVDIINDYRNGLINDETYKLEKDFVSYLTVFANLKKYLEAYRLNYKSGNSEGLGKNLFKIFERYRELMKTQNELAQKYKNNHTYKKVFKSEFQHIMNYAKIYLEEDHYLKSCYLLAQSLYQIENTERTKIDSSQNENLLKDLHFASFFPKSDMKSPEGQLINLRIKELEKNQYKNYYQQYEQGSNAYYSEIYGDLKTLEKYARETSCNMCKDSLQTSIDKLKKLIHDEKLKQVRLQYDSLKEASETKVFTYISDLELIHLNLEKNSEIKTDGLEHELSSRKLKSLQLKMDVLKTYFGDEQNESNLENLKAFNEKLKNLLKGIDEDLAFLRKHNSKWFTSKDELVKRNKEEAELKEWKGLNRRLDSLSNVLKAQIELFKEDSILVNDSLGLARNISLVSDSLLRESIRITNTEPINNSLRKEQMERGMILEENILRHIQNMQNKQN